MDAFSPFLLNASLFYISALCGCLFLQFFTGKIRFSGRYKLLEFIYVPVFSTIAGFGVIDFFNELEGQTMLCCAGIWAFAAFTIVILENWHNLSIIGLLVRISLAVKTLRMAFKGEINKLEDQYRDLEKDIQEKENEKK